MTFSTILDTISQESLLTFSNPFVSNKVTALFLFFIDSNEDLSSYLYPE